jgi:hypothetical protein
MRRASASLSKRADLLGNSLPGRRIEGRASGRTNPPVIDQDVPSDATGIGRQGLVKPRLAHRLRRKRDAPIAVSVYDHTGPQVIPSGVGIVDKFAGIKEAIGMRRRRYLPLYIAACRAHCYSALRS